LNLINLAKESGANINDIVSEYPGQLYPQNTYLYFAASVGDLELIKLLLKAGADVNIQNEYGINALHLASL
jgi:hypothetical protein